MINAKLMRGFENRGSTKEEAGALFGGLKQLENAKGEGTKGFVILKGRQ